MSVSGEPPSLRIYTFWCRYALPKLNCIAGFCKCTIYAMGIFKILAGLPSFLGSPSVRPLIQ